MRQRPSAVWRWPRCSGLVSQTRATLADLNRLPTGKPAARAWCSSVAVMSEGWYCVMNPAGNSKVLT